MNNLNSAKYNFKSFKIYINLNLLYSILDFGVDVYIEEQFNVKSSDES